MARPKKFDYDSDDFYDEILALSMQGLTEAGDRHRPTIVGA